ncbi:hypothetical protein VTJ83DRAFT_1112 [Remersonia thermophila]|uniref:Uncharacterized protein n=1 Tax=Remersonia thermophila TaxID=72144 RepID=A0ABR4DN30_9PEZI
MPINWSSLYSLLSPPAALRDVFFFSQSQPAVEDDQANPTTTPGQTDSNNNNNTLTMSRAAAHRSPSMSSSTSSASTSTTSLSTEDSGVAPRRSATHVVNLDPLSRTFPKPDNEPSLEELLARKPPRHSLHHVLRNPREPPAAVAARLSEEAAKERQRKFEEAKRKLLEAKEELDRGRRI